MYRHNDITISLASLRALIYMNFFLALVAIYDLFLILAKITEFCSNVLIMLLDFSSLDCN